MERIRSSGQPVTRIKSTSDQQPVRIRSDAVQEEPVKRITNNPVPNEHGVFEKENGKFYIIVDGVEWPCSRSGDIRDHQTDTHVSMHGKIFKKVTDEEAKACDLVIAEKMRECFPEDHDPFHQVVKKITHHEYPEEEAEEAEDTGEVEVAE